jgi:hypothetical protein
MELGFMNHRVIRSKMKKAKPLMDDPIMSRHVPEMYWLNDASFQRMLQTYPTVYIKPDKGRKGNGIIRLKKLNDWESEISYRQTITKRIPSDIVVPEIKKLYPRKKYLIQQGIELATCNHCPFDLRLVLKKPLNRWLVSMMSARIAPRNTSVVTNVAKGAKEITITEAFRN